MTQEKPQNPILKAHLEGVAEFNKTFGTLSPSDIRRDADVEQLLYDFENFLTTYAKMILNAAKEAGPGKKPEEKYNELKHQELRMGIIQGHNSCLSSFISAIDEGIEGIRKGDL